MAEARSLLKEPTLPVETNAWQDEALIRLGMHTQEFTRQQILERERLYHFLLGAWYTLNPNRKLETNWHLGFISEYLELVKSGEIRRLLINICPRSLKSTLVTVCFPCWEWIDFAWYRYVFMSYSSSLANDHSDIRRKLIQSDWYQGLLDAPMILSDTKNRISEFENNYRGAMIARGLEGSVTGVGGDRLIFDDPNNPEKVESDKIRDGTGKKFKDYSVGRQDDPKETAVIVVQQRTHEQDCSGIVQELGGYVIVKVPTRAPTKILIEFPRSSKLPKSHPDYVAPFYREAGTLLQPHRHGEDEDAEAKRTLGSYMYSSRHDQEPAPPGGGIFKHDWWCYYTELPQAYELAISIDASFGSVTDVASYVVIQLWAIAYPRFYLHHQIRRRMTFLDTVKTIRDALEDWGAEFERPIITKLVEKKANGAAVIESLQDEFPGIIPVIPDESKQSRAEAVSPIYEAGNVLLRENAPYVVDYQIEHEKFPNAGTDDQVDGTSQLIDYFLRKYRRKRRPAGSVNLSNT